MRGQFVEKWYPLLFAAVAGAAWVPLDLDFPPDPTGLFGAAATVASVFAGFLGASKAIILTMKGNEAVKRLTDLGYTALLYLYLAHGVVGAVGFAFISVVGFFIYSNQPSHQVICLFEASWIALAAFSLASYYRITSIIFKLLQK